MAVGPGLAWDSRDHSLAPHRGAFYDIVLMSSQPSLGSTYEFTTMVFDLRQYFPIRPGHTFAGNVYIAVQDGQAPFYQLPQLGGDELLRGYFEGRYRDKTLMLAQAEYRFPILWRIGGTAFGGLGNVSPTFREFGETAPKWSVGAGLRLMLNRDERLNLRADLGIARGAQGFYVGIGEVF
jgi:outer membrane protein assembly factor BamA